jgi:hypothetical protein
MPSVSDLSGADLLAPGLTALAIAFCIATRWFILPAAARLLLQARLDELAQDLDVAWLRGRIRPDRREAWLDVVRRVRRDPRRELETALPALLPEDLPKRYAERLRDLLDAYAADALPMASRPSVRAALAAAARPTRGQRSPGTPGPVARRARTAVVVTALSVVAVAVTAAFAVSTDWVHEAYAGRTPTREAGLATAGPYRPSTAGVGQATSGTTTAEASTTTTAATTSTPTEVSHAVAKQLSTAATKKPAKKKSTKKVVKKVAKKKVAKKKIATKPATPVAAAPSTPVETSITVRRVIPRYL